MTRQVSTFTIGLFVTVGVIIGVSIIVWVGASKYFERGSLYVTYFDESVQGLQRDSSVKYRGVDIGRIMKIGVAPDNKLIEVVMKIDLKNDLEKNTVTQLKAVGITGIVYVELDRQDSGMIERSPKIDFTAEYPVIPSRPSETRQILSGIDEVLNKIKMIDFRGISDQIKATAKSADNFLAGSRTNRVMSNLESATTALDKSMSRLEKFMSEGNLEKTFTEARHSLTDVRKAVAEVRTFISGVKNEVKAMKLTETADKTNQVIDTLDRGIRASAVDVQTSTENLKRASESLERLLDRLEAHPSDLIWSSPPETSQERTN
jgi:phospholipid/cholesterol/gamma-HCH transport system substrate-binding protein